MASTTTSTTDSGLQPSGVPQNNDSKTVQQQNQNSLPSSTLSKDLQPNNGDVNTIKTNSLSVKSGPNDTNGSKRVSGTTLSIILVVIILAVAAGLFIASFRVPEETKTKPAVAPGAETSGALGSTKKKTPKTPKKKKKSKK